MTHGSGPPAGDSQHRPAPSSLRELERRFQAAALHALGLQPEDREGVVRVMFQRRARDAVGYWLQLMLSMGIATLGLALGSTAVVIGAMLISPLMAPIVELGMGLVIGSPTLTIRSVVRVVGSVAAVVVGAALLTLLLPFHEVNAEIAARTLPTALDLLIATFVALAAAFATVRPLPDTTSTAVGAAIGISLVPPLCVIGFGVGTRSAAVAGGASLLFSANLSAILLVATVSFLLLGFDQVSTASWESISGGKIRVSRGTAWAIRVLRAAFGARYSRVLRVGVPLLLLAAVALPLSRALDKVAWEVRTRTAVQRATETMPMVQNAVQSVVHVGDNTVTLRLFVVASAEQAADLEDRLRTRIREAAGVDPTVQVFAVPDLDALRQAAAAPQSAPSLAGATPPHAANPPSWGGLLRRLWPTDQLGPLLAWRAEPRDSAGVRITVVHLGQPIGPAAEALLGRSLTEQAGTAVQVRTRSFPAEAVVAPAPAGVEWLPALVRSLAMLAEVEGVYACVSIPAAADQGRVARLVRAELAAAPAGRATLLPASEVWSVRLSKQPCAPIGEISPNAA